MKDVFYNDKLFKAFDELKKLGYFAEEDWMCCQSCGCAAVPDDQKDKYIFYHHQDFEDLESSGSCYIAWAGDGKLITDIFAKHSLSPQWDGDSASRILITI